MSHREPEHQVTLLTQSDCHLCDHAKAVVTRVASDHRLQLREISLSTEAGQAMATDAGVLFAPGVFLDGRLIGYGRLSERKLRRALASAAHR